MMIAKKPKVTEEQFLRGKNGSAGSTTTAYRLHLRLPDELHKRLSERAWQERISLNALICALLDAAVGASGTSGAKGGKR